MNVKHYIIAAIISNLFVSLAAGSCRSHTFFVPRQVTTNSTFELGLNNYHWYHERVLGDQWYFSMYATPFLQQTTQGKKIAQYFLRGGKECLTFREINEDPCDIESLWFGLESDVNTNFNATFAMKPQRRTFGGYFNMYLAKGWESHYLWFNVAFAAMRAEHKLRMCEAIEELPGPLSNFALGTIDEFTSVISALNNPEWCFGKFSPCKLTRTGVDDIQVKIGYDWFYSLENHNHISPYIVGTIPTGKRQRSEFIFEPLVGSKNGSIGVGINLDCDCYHNDSHSLTWLFDVKYRFVFSANQCRSFDLCVNGDWSRYLLVVPQDQHLATQPGINLFSLSAKVEPRSTIDAWTAFHWQWSEFNLELGYNFWWRQKEKICLNCDIADGFGIFDLAGSGSVPQSASQANISQSVIGSNKAPSDASFVVLKTQDLDLNSAAHPNTFSSTIYAGLGWHPTPGGFPLLLGLGGQYEFAHNKAALEQWAVWGKLGIIF